MLPTKVERIVDHWKSLSRTRRAGLLAGLVVALATTVTAVQAQWGLPWNWFYYIHCSGDNTNHTDGTEPDSESYTNALNEQVTQCHGTPGEQGGCSFSTASAWCVVKPHDIETCHASYQCPSGTINCGGQDQEAFAGEIVEEGKKYGFVLCKNSGTSSGMTRDTCEL